LLHFLRGQGAKKQSLILNTDRPHFGHLMVIDPIPPTMTHTVPKRASSQAATSDRIPKLPAIVGMIETTAIPVTMTQSMKMDARTKGLLRWSLVITEP
jgi:hypothetical protein